MILIAYEYIDQEAPGASLSPPLRSKNSSPKTGPTLALTSPSGIENLTFKFYKLFIKYFKSTISTMIYIAIYILFYVLPRKYVSFLIMEDIFSFPFFF